jgi:hypothetical protein
MTVLGDNERAVERGLLQERAVMGVDLPWRVRVRIPVQLRAPALQGDLPHTVTAAGEEAQERGGIRDAAGQATADSDDGERLEGRLAGAGVLVLVPLAAL